MALWLGLRVAAAPVINTNLLSLLPKAETDPVVLETVGRVQKRFERQMVWLVGADDAAAARAAALTVRDGLAVTGRFADLTLRHGGERLQRTGAFYLSLRFNLLTRKAQRQLTTGDAKAFEQDILRRYFAPQSMLNSALISRDPLMLLPAFLEERIADLAERPVVEDGFLTLRKDDRTYVVLFGSLKETPFAFAEQERLLPVIADLKDRVASDVPGGEVLMAGVLPHAAAGSRQALNEMSNVGLGSTLGILMLMFLVFRSFTPLMLSLVSIGVGVAGGFAACLMMFGSVHLLTLILGSSLLGISVDYSFHFFCRRFRDAGNWSPAEALRHVRPGILLGLVTSVIGFCGLLLAPFQGMRELAVYSSVGLCFAFVCVVAWFPLFSGGLKYPGHPRLLSLAEGYRALWRRRRGATLAGLAGVLIAAAAGCFQLTAQDDVRLLQTPDPDVLAEELKTRALIGRNLSSQFFLVEGRDEADLLTREEALTEKLRALKDDKRLAGYIAMSDFIPSPGRQAANRALIEKAVIGENSVLAHVARAVGLTDAARLGYAEAFATSPETGPGLRDWLAAPVSEPYRHLWVGETPRGVMGIVGLKGVFDLAALRAIAQADPMLHFVDPAGDISGLFAKYRMQTVWLTLLSYSLVALILVLRYGLKGGALVLAVPAVATVAALGAVGLIGETISLFNIMALLLVLGIGVDYAIFFRETGDEHPSTLLAIALSSTTTMLAFGLLVFSKTTAVHAFGLTILVGIAVAFLVSPLAGWAARGRQP